MLSGPFDGLFGLDISSILENRPKELSLRQNESYLKQFNFGRLSSLISLHPSEQMTSHH